MRGHPAVAGAFVTIALTDTGTGIAADRIDQIFEPFFTTKGVGMSGIELGQEIRRRHPALPVMLTSGYSAGLARDGTHGFDLLQKPYSIDALARVLRKVAPAERRAPAKQFLGPANPRVDCIPTAEVEIGGPIAAGRPHCPTSSCPTSYCPHARCRPPRTRWQARWTR